MLTIASEIEHQHVKDRSK